MAFIGDNPIRNKICINNHIIEQVNSFTYLEYNLIYNEEKDMDNKITKFNRALSIINQVFKSSLVQRHTRIRAYKTLARPLLTYGSEAWTLKK